MSTETFRGFRLSPQQRRLWLLQREGRAYSSQCVVLIDGALDAEALREAARELVARHEILRTNFRRPPGLKVAYQVINDAASHEWAARDLSALDGHRRDEEAGRLAREERERPWDFEAGAPLRLLLLKIGAVRHLLVITLPSLCADTRTLVNLFAELCDAYAAREAGEEPLQYADFSEWQNELLEEEREAAESYWPADDSADFAQARLPFEGAPVAPRDFAPGVFAAEFGRELSERIETAARRGGADCESFLLACWQTLLSRLTARPEVVTALHCDGRVSEETEGAFGLYARWPLVKGRTEGAFRFREVFEQSAAAARRAREWQQYFSAEAQPALAAEPGDAAPAPFGFEFAERPAARTFGALRLSPLTLRSWTERLKLKLSCTRAEGSLVIEFHYDASVFDRAEVELLAERFASLADFAAREPETLVSELELLGARERRRLLEEWNDTRAEYESDLCVHRAFERQAAKTPDALAVVHEDLQLTHAELNRRANRLARHLRRLGVGRESLVALCLERSEAMFVGLLAALKCGAAYVPLDPGQPAERLGLMLAEAPFAALLTEEALAKSLPAHGARVVRMDADADQFARERADDLNVEVSPDDLAYVIYTSGSTGRPKGVMIAHRSVMNLSAALDAAVYADNVELRRVSVNAPLAFDSSVKQVVQLLGGRALVVVPEAVRREGAELLAFARRHALDVLDCTPAQLKLMLAVGPLDGAARVALVGGEAVEESVWATLSADPRSVYFNVYGPTECTVDATACRIGAPFVRPSLGRPLNNVRVYVCDGRLNLAPAGLAGELLVGGAGLARGYLNAPGLTASKFVPDPFGGEPGARLYHTGDAARQGADGGLEYLGRIDRQLKVRGNRVEPGEIEAALARHEEVREAVVVAREDEPGDARLVAYVVARDGRRPEPAGLRGFLRDKLPEYMLPAAFVHLDRLPLTRNGKVDRDALPAPQEEGDDGTGATKREARTPVEEVLAGLCAQVLRVKEVGVEDNFFERGGHSLLATQLVSRVRQAFNVELPLRHLFEAPTMAGLAERVEALLRSGRGAGAPPIARAARGRELPLSFAQQRLWFLQQLEPESAYYNVHRVVRLEGRLGVQALEQTLSEIVRRHEVLRTTFPVADGQPFQLIGPAEGFRVPLVDLSALPHASRESAVKSLAARMSSRPFDLARGPVLRAALLRLGEREHVFLLAMHHVVSDGWAMGLLVREVAALYAAFVGGEQSPLAELEIQYADFAVWQRGWLQGEVLESHLDYWRRQLAGCPTTLALPSDRPRPAAQSFRGAALPLALSAELTEGLKSLSRGEGATLFMTLVAGLKALLHWYTGQSDIVVGADIANRNRAETEALVGFFVNILALRTDLSGDPTFRELLRREREVTLAAYARQDLPFEKVIEALQPERSLSHAPIVQAVFVLQNAPLDAPQQMPGLTLTPLRVEYAATKFDLVVTVWEGEEGLRGLVEYSTDLFDASTAARVFERYVSLLGEAATRPDATLSRLGEALTEAERAGWAARRQSFKDARRPRPAAALG